MKKWFMVFIALLTINSCYWSEGCLYTPQMVNCYVDKGELYPSIARYQKQGSIGHTDSAQRWKDAVACGARYGDIGLDGIQENYINFKQCMEIKGYHHFNHTECGYQNPKWSTGKCNL